MSELQHQRSHEQALSWKNSYRGAFKKMADLDEEAINQPLSSSHDPSANIDQDVSDETQDFRFLSTFAT